MPKLLHGDILAKLKKLPDESVQAVIADPPYFKVLEDEDWDNQWEDSDAYLKWCADWVSQCLRVLRPDGLCFIFGQLGKREHTFIHLMSLLSRQHQFHDLLVWDRAVGYNERRDSFTPQYELILVLRKGPETKFIKDAVRIPYDTETIKIYLRDKRYKDKAAREDHLQRGKFATNILRVPSLKGLSKERCGHPSQKPLDLITKLIACSTDEGDTVLDPFMGSGTTAVAATQMKRDWIGIEVDAAYIKIIRSRLKTPSISKSPHKSASPSRKKA